MTWLHLIMRDIDELFTGLEICRQAGMSDHDLITFKMKNRINSQSVASYVYNWCLKRAHLPKLRKFWEKKNHSRNYVNRKMRKKIECAQKNSPLTGQGALISQLKSGEFSLKPYLDSVINFGQQLEIEGFVPRMGEECSLQSSSSTSRLEMSLHWWQQLLELDGL